MSHSAIPFGIFSASCKQKVYSYARSYPNAGLEILLLDLDGKGREGAKVVAVAAVTRIFTHILSNIFERPSPRV